MEIENFIANRENEEIRFLLNECHQVITQTLPEVQGSIKWRVPFYHYGKKPLCYLTPKPKHIIIGFVKGIHLNNYHQKLVGNQKQIRHFIVKSHENIWSDDLIGTLLEAAELNLQGDK